MLTYRFRSLFRNISKAVKLYYLSLGAGLVLAFALTDLVTSSSPPFYEVKAAFTAGFGIALFFALSMLGQRYGRALIWNGLGLLLLAAFYFLILPATEEAFNRTYVYILVPAYILTHLLVALAPYLYQQQEEEKFWHYNKKLFINLFLTVVFSLVLTGGIILAIWGADTLFLLQIDDDFYLKVFLFLVSFGSVLVFSLFCTDGLRELESTEIYPEALKFFIQYILIPLLLIYLTILYLYEIKIILTWQLPDGGVTYLIWAYSVVGLLTLLLISPLIKQGSKAWVYGFKRGFFYSLFPLLVLLFIAIGVRIKAYGITEARYFILFLACWLLFIAMYFTIAKKPALKTIPYALFAGGLIILIIPYLNVFYISAISQKKQFYRLLEDNQLLKDNRIQFEKPVSHELVYNLNDKFNYLQLRNKTSLIADVFDPETFENLKNTAEYYPFTSLFRYIAAPETDYKPPAYHFETLQNKHKYYQLDDQTLVYTFNTNRQEEFTFARDTIKFTPHYNAYPKIRLSVNKDTVVLDTLIGKSIRPYPDQAAELPEDASVPFNIGDYTAKIIFKHININRNTAQDSLFIRYAEGILLLHKNREQQSHQDFH